MITVYGLKNCDTCRKARKWLTAQGLEHRFHDVRADGLDATTVKAWTATLGWEKLLNRRGTTWRGLGDADKQDLDQEKAVALMTAQPALIKRPVFDVAGTYALGFDDQVQTMLNGENS